MKYTIRTLMEDLITLSKLSIVSRDYTTEETILIVDALSQLSKYNYKEFTTVIDQNKDSLPNKPFTRMGILSSGVNIDDDNLPYLENMAKYLVTKVLQHKSLMCVRLYDDSEDNYQEQLRNDVLSNYVHHKVKMGSICNSILLEDGKTIIEFYPDKLIRDIDYVTYLVNKIQEPSPIIGDIMLTVCNFRTEYKYVINFKDGTTMDIDKESVEGLDIFKTLESKITAVEGVEC